MITWLALCFVMEKVGVSPTIIFLLTIGKTLQVAIQAIAEMK